MSGLAALAAVAQRDDHAARLLGAAVAMSGERPPPQIAGRLEERFFAPSRARLGAASWEHARDAGARLDRDEAIEGALRGIDG